jgi:hypothetical protein
MLTGDRHLNRFLLNSITLCKADFRTVAPDSSGSTGAILVGMLAMTSVAVSIFRQPRSEYFLAKSTSPESSLDTLFYGTGIDFYGSRQSPGCGGRRR